MGVLPMTEWTTVSIQKDLVRKLKPLVGRAGFSSMSDIITYAVQKMMFEFNRLLAEIEEADKHGNDEM